MALSRAQRQIAQQVLGVGKKMGASKKELKAAIETGLVESNFSNSGAMTDHDSQGWRQERKSLYKDPTNVQHSAQRFFNETKAVRGKYGTAGALAAAVQRPAAQYRGRYQEHSGDAASILQALGGSGGGSPLKQGIRSRGKSGRVDGRTVTDGGSTTTSTPGLTIPAGSTGLADQIKAAQAQQPQAPMTPPSAPTFSAGAKLAMPQGASGLVTPSSTPTVAATQSDLTDQIDSTRALGQTDTVLPGSTNTVENPDISTGGRSPRGGGGSRGGSPRGGGRGSSGGAQFGHVNIAAGANRAGVGLQKPILHLARQAAGVLGKPVTLGTGTNHNRTVAGSSNVSDHWAGNAGDFPQANDSKQGDHVASAFLQSLGVPASRAQAMARAGGVFNVAPTKGAYRGKKAQVLWKTDVGGNHHDHVHVGVK